MILAGDIQLIDPSTWEIVEQGCYYRELRGIYFMRMGIQIMETINEKGKKVC